MITVAILWKWCCDIPLIYLMFKLLSHTASATGVISEYTVGVSGAIAL